MPTDPTLPPEYVRVPLDEIVDYRRLLQAIGEARTERMETRTMIVGELAAVRAEVHDHIQAERPVLDAYHRYLQRLDVEETGAAAVAVAKRRTADEDADATRANRRKWTERIIFAALAASVIAADHLIDRLSTPLTIGGTTVEIGAPHEP